MLPVARTILPWRESVAGWTSWFAFFDRVTEADIRRPADVLSEVLLPFGYQYLQIDDGFQRTPICVPDNWLRWESGGSCSTHWTARTSPPAAAR